MKAMHLCNFIVGMLIATAAHAQHSMAMMTAAQRPVTAKSNEATKKQLAFARAEGDSVDRCLSWLQSETRGSGQVKAGEYTITYALGAPEGWYEMSNNTAQWHEPLATDAAHLWVFVQDGADGRVVPPLQITYSLANSSGAVVSQGALPYAWTPLVNGYGENVSLSGAGNYTLTLKINPPAYRRHDSYNGDRFTKATTALATLPFAMQSLPAKPLSEAMEAQQALSAGAGNAYHNTLLEMYSQANDGRDTTAGDCIVAYAVEYAEGYWHYEGDKFRYMGENDMSGKTNAHVEVSVRDARTGRFVHDLDVTAQLTQSGNNIGMRNEPFMWHPWLYHYGENWRIPKSGAFDLVLHIKPPAYRRYGKATGQQFSTPLDLTFNHIILKAGQK